MELNKEDILSLLNNVKALEAIDVDSLICILNQYPYFQPIYFLLLRYYKEKDEAEYANLLKKAVVHVSNRKHLFKYINLSHAKTILTEKPVENSGIEPAEPSIRKEEKEFLSDAIADAVSQQISGKTETGFEQRLLPEITFELDESIEIIRPKDVATVDFAIENDILDTERIDQSILIIEDEQIKQDVRGVGFEFFEKKTDNSALRFSPEKANNKNDLSENISLDIGGPEDGVTGQSEITGPEPDLIDKFLADMPKIRPKQVEEFVEYDISTNSVEEHDDFMTETLAKIFVRQKNYQKAIDTYSKLSLKFPEKSTYFANQIFEIKKLMNNQ
ncbi:MAG TPA: hypothetical protein VIO15_07350 [Bacteroidales bacterium]